MIGTPIALAGTANAAPDSAWDKLASCESGNRWNIATGNGYYGGVQFSPTTWVGYGGREFAPMAHQATREQQIAVAERVLAAQGWNAWPSCSSKMGLRGFAAEPNKIRASAPAPAAVPVAAPAVAITRTGATHTVVSGDTLSKIAAQYNVAGGWQALFNRNTDVLSSPNVLRVGQVLKLG